MTELREDTVVGGGRRIYIIHAATDAAIAAVLKAELERSGTDVRVFVASKPGDIPTGADWLREIHENLRAADVYIPLLTPRSIVRPWVWYESGAAWFSERRRLPIVAGGLDPGNIPYPLGAAQALRLDDPEHAAQFFRDIDAALGDPSEFARRIREAAESADQAAEHEEGWVGIKHDGGFFAWHGPLAGLDDKAGVPPAAHLVDALVGAGMTVTWGNIDRLEHLFNEGRMQVFQTDRRTWKRPIVRSPDGKQVLLVHVEDELATMVQDLRREHEFNEAVAARRGSNELGTAFALGAIRRALNTGLAARLGKEMHDALLQANGAMDRANRAIEASLQFQRGSNAWAKAVNSASDAMSEAGGPLVTLRAHLKRKS